MSNCLSQLSLSLPRACRTWTNGRFCTAVALMLHRRCQGYCVVGLFLVTVLMRSCGRWSARLVARAMLDSPLLRWYPIEVLRSVANTAGPLPVRAWWASSRRVTSRTFSRGGARSAELDLRVSAGQRLVVMKLPDATGVVQRPCGVSRHRVAAAWLSRVISSRFAARA